MWYNGNVVLESMLKMFNCSYRTAKKNTRKGYRKMKKRLSAALAALILLSVSAGCSNNKTGDTASTGSGASDSVISSDSFEAWKNIDRDTVVAYVEGADSEKFNVTFGEFYGEYLYYLLSYNIADDMSEQYKDACEAYREDIITYLTFEKTFLQIAEESGCGMSSLTNEEKEIIRANIETTTNNFVSGYTTLAEEELGEGASEDDILNRCTEMLVADLAKAELTTDIFEKWETNNYIQEKLIKQLTKDIEITDAAVDEMFNQYVEMAKTALEADKVSYEMDTTLTWVYVPEGTRLADQILVAFDSETQAAIKEARSAGDDAKADTLRTEAYNAEIREKVNNIYALIEGGSDFNKLQETYNEDSTNDPYSVIVDSALYVPEFTEAIFSVDNIGDVAEPAISDYGVHIIRYEGDDSVTEEDKKEIYTSMKDYLIYQEETAVQEAAYAEWSERYPYTIDYALLKITPDATADDVIVSE